MKNDSSAYELHRTQPENTEIIYTNFYERENDMASRNRRNNNNNQNANHNANNSQPNNALSNSIRQWLINNAAVLFLTIITTIIGGLILNLIGDVKDLSVSVGKLETTVENNSTDISEMRNDIKDMDGRLLKIETQMASLDTRVGNLEEQMEKTEEKLESVSDSVWKIQLSTSEPTVSMYSSIQIDTAKKDNAQYLSAPRWETTEVLFVNKTEDIEFTAQELVGSELFVPYTQDRQQILFKGQFNENNQWDGPCTLNIYENGKLELLMEANYDNGVIANYRQVLPFTNTNGIRVWGIAERTNTGAENTGITRTYLQAKECNRLFNFNEAAIGDMMSVDEFAKEYTGALEGFYQGNTSNGYFNDNTGDAYMIKFASDGTVRNFYQGCFANGKCEDFTGNAWNIARDENNPDMKYLYYKGDFSDNTADKTRSEGIVEPDLTKEQIDQYLSASTVPEEILSTLHWYELEDGNL